MTDKPILDASTLGRRSSAPQTTSTPMPTLWQRLTKRGKE